MGNKSGSIRSKLGQPSEVMDDEELDEESDRRKNSKKKVIQILPYNQDAVETGFVSPILQYLPQQQQQNASLAKRPRSLCNVNIVDYVSDLESKLDEQFHGSSLSESLRNEFIGSSKENKIGRKQFLKLVGLEQQSNAFEASSSANNQETESTYGSNCMFLSFFFKTCMGVLDASETGEFMDYSKVLKFTQLMAIADEEEQLEFFFSLFDTNGDGKMEKDELKEFLTLFFDFLVQTPFSENQSELAELKNDILMSKEKDIATAIKNISYSFNQDHCSKEGYLGYEQWKHWITNEYQFSQIHQASRTQHQ